MIKLYWTNEHADPCCKLFEGTQLVDALKMAKQLRQSGARFVCISSEHPDCVTKAGVDAVTDGKTPDGADYTWMKRRNQ